MTPDDLVTPVRAAAYLGIGVSTLRRYAAEGRISPVVISGVRFYRRRDLDRLKRPQIGRPPKRRR